MRTPPPVRQRIAARLLLAACTLAIGLGLGTAVAVLGVLDLQHPRIMVTSPGQREATLDRGIHELFVLRNAPGGGPPVSVSQPSCAVTGVDRGEVAASITPDAGFAALSVPIDGTYRVVCTSAIPVTVDVAHVGEPLSAYLKVLGGGLVPAVTLTVLAAVLAARALVSLRHLPRPDR